MYDAKVWGKEGQEAVDKRETKQAIKGGRCKSDSREREIEKKTKQELGSPFLPVSSGTPGGGHRGPRSALLHVDFQCPK